MANITKIAFDLDGVFVNNPPFVPKSVIEQLYKKSSNHLSYRIPGKLEKKIRTLSHHYLLRPAIKSNIDVLKEINKNKQLSISLISSRFSFLKEKTKIWMRKNKLDGQFTKTYFNFSDQQPHIFKDNLIKKEDIKKYVDDDLDLLTFLAEKNPKVDFFWLNTDSVRVKFPNNIKKITKLREFISYL